MGPSCACFGGLLFFKGRGWGFQTNLHWSTGGVPLQRGHPPMPRGLRVWHVPERKNHVLDCSRPPLCSGFPTHRQLGTAYVSATTGAVATALGLKSLTKVNAAPIPRVASHPLSASFPITPPHQPTDFTYLFPEFLTTPWPLGPLNDIFPPPALAPSGRQICALCSCGSRKLHQHPSDEAEVSGPNSWPAHARRCTTSRSRDCPLLP